jgi:chromosome segregation ATPase
VKKKTLQVLLSWQQQFKDDPGMQYVAKLYKTVKPAQPKAVDPAVLAEERRRKEAEDELKRRAAELELREKKLNNLQEEKDHTYAKEIDRQQRIDEARRKIEESRRKVEATRRAEEERKAAAKNKSKEKSKPKPAPSSTPKRKWDYEKEKPLILQSIAAASLASSNLVNAITVGPVSLFSTRD